MITKKIKNFFKNDSQIWQEKYEAKRQEARTWEFKFNKLNRQIQAVIEEANK